jgi:primase-polymerase (primpol)-like protein
MFSQIPEELKALRQWINWRHHVTLSGKPTKQPICTHNGTLASVTNPLHWSSFNDVVSRAYQFDGIGFVFTNSDPYCGIDLDEPEDVETISSHKNILNTFATYAECSPSYSGVHIIVKAKLPGAARRRRKVEMYDCDRYFTFTGAKCNDYGVACLQAETEALYATLGAPSYIPTMMFGEAQTADDLVIIEMAKRASNGDKFERLFNGNWQFDYGHASQSEADFALVNIIAFYTKNIEQITRLFLMSGLGQRDKAKRKAHISYNPKQFAYLPWLINRAFDRMPPKADLDALHNQRLALLASLKG